MARIPSHCTKLFIHDGLAVADWPIISIIRWISPEQIREIIQRKLPGVRIRGITVMNDDGTHVEVTAPVGPCAEIFVSVADDPDSEKAL